MSDSHLGGHLNKTHIDGGVLDYMIRYFDIASMLDVGCGPGGMYHVANCRGVYWVGIDGDSSLDFNETPVHITDFTLDKCRDIIDQKFDLGWSIEFLEHVEEKYMHNYMHAFRQCKYVVVTAALPGAPGHHHVNCRINDYWIGAFAANGFKYEHKHTQEIRRISTMVKGFMSRTGMVFSEHE